MDCEFCSKDGTPHEIVTVYSHRLGRDRHYCTGCGNPLD